MGHKIYITGELLSAPQQGLKLGGGLQLAAVDQQVVNELEKRRPKSVLGSRVTR